MRMSTYCGPERARYSTPNLRRVRQYEINAAKNFVYSLRSKNISTGDGGWYVRFLESKITWENFESLLCTATRYGVLMARPSLTVPAARTQANQGLAQQLLMKVDQAKARADTKLQFENNEIKNGSISIFKFNVKRKLDDATLQRVKDDEIERLKAFRSRLALWSASGFPGGSCSLGSQRTARSSGRASPRIWLARPRCKNLFLWRPCQRWRSCAHETRSRLGGSDSRSHRCILRQCQQERTLSYLKVLLKAPSLFAANGSPTMLKAQSEADLEVLEAARFESGTLPDIGIRDPNESPFNRGTFDPDESPLIDPWSPFNDPNDPAFNDPNESPFNDPMSAASSEWGLQHDVW
ncbi:unnamed protein product [Zymoseptoria tritici ST99CH_1E4]|uniref:Uncharacterized protein n=1 Tax=Zymoseptoria tritici ST99CH_1E4 TaxID=1276532 RepID=A0A2H1FKG3_ZYMTR|nr:unnamed protein product [Zymoseptoria tritici ST99CH_1E4]